LNLEKIQAINLRNQVVRFYFSRPVSPFAYNAPAKVCSADFLKRDFNIVRILNTVDISAGKAQGN